MSGDQQSLLSYRAGAELREEGIAIVIANNAEFVATMREVAVRIAKERGSVHGDDLRYEASKMGLAPKSSAAWGAIWQRGKWRIVGYRASAWITNRSHVGPVRVLA